jgi:hypothetical protein
MKPDLPMYTGKNHSLNFIGGLEGGDKLCSSVSGKTFKIIAFHTLKDKISRIKQ